MCSCARAGTSRTRAGRKFIHVFGDHQMVDGARGVRSEFDLLTVLEFVDDEWLHHFLEVAFVVQELSVLQYLFIRLLLHAGECFEKVALGLRERAALLQSLVDAGVLGIAPILGAELIVLAI